METRTFIRWDEKIQYYLHVVKKDLVVKEKIIMQEREVRFALIVCNLIMIYNNSPLIRIFQYLSKS